MKMTSFSNPNRTETAKNNNKNMETSKKKTAKQQDIR